MLSTGSLPHIIRMSRCGAGSLQIMSLHDREHVFGTCPQVASSKKVLGLIRSELEPEETRGLTRSGDLSRMLPSEAHLMASGWPVSATPQHQRPLCDLKRVSLHHATSLPYHWMEHVSCVCHLHGLTLQDVACVCP